MTNLRNNIMERQEAAVAFAESLRPMFERWVGSGCSQRKMVELLNESGIKTIKGGAWRLSQVQRVMDRLSISPAERNKRLRTMPTRNLSEMTNDQIRALLARLG